ERPRTVDDLVDKGVDQTSVYIRVLDGSNATSGELDAHRVTTPAPHRARRCPRAHAPPTGPQVEFAFEPIAHPLEGPSPRFPSGSYFRQLAFTRARVVVAKIADRCA